MFHDAMMVYDAIHDMMRWMIHDALEEEIPDPVPAKHIPVFQYYAVTFDYTEKLRNVLIGLRKRLV